MSRPTCQRVTGSATYTRLLELDPARHGTKRDNESGRFDVLCGFAADFDVTTTDGDWLGRFCALCLPWSVRDHLRDVGSEVVVSRAAP